MKAERFKRLKEVPPHVYVDRQTGIVHFDLIARMRALGVPTDARTKRAVARATFKQWRAVGVGRCGAVIHMSPMFEQ